MGTSKNIQIKILTEVDVERWDHFVEHCPTATFFHRSGWQEILQKSLGHSTYFLYAEIDGAIRGILPLGHIKSRLFSNALISLPFCVYGGIASNSEIATHALIDSARELAESLKVDYIELRNQKRNFPDWQAKDDFYVTFRKKIDPDPAVNLKSIPRKQRAMIRKGIQFGLRSHIDQNVERFYMAYSESVRNLGTPVLPLKYFRLLKATFGESCEISTVTQNNKLVASVMSFYFRNQVLPYYGGGTTLAREVKGNDFMYWDLMQHASERGITEFDYGRSKVGTGSYHFKKNWGFEPEPLYYEFRLIQAQEIPNINPLNPKYRHFINLWRRLPLSISQLIGPFISRNLG